MFVRITLVVLYIIFSFRASFCEKQKHENSFQEAWNKITSKVKLENSSNVEELYNANQTDAEELYNATERVLDCADLYEKGHTKSGVYSISPKRLKVFCDMTTEGGGWTVIQRRGDYNREDDYFDKDWKSYKMGFGNIKKDFWLGNDNIFVLTNQKEYTVRFDLVDQNENVAYAEYDRFKIDDESSKYTLHISDYRGTAGNAMALHDQMKFSTKDNDNDLSSINCAIAFRSGWWFNDCYDANLNGMPNMIQWHKWKNSGSLRQTEIKIRPIYF